ncbi:MAG: hypothetical protein NTX93_03505 [Bacteroidia bacterium]|nr:hypothetical protein [Bacteroidia bacterium]
MLNDRIKLFGLGIASIVSMNAAAQKITQQRPNIIYIMSDDHAYQAISAYGGSLKDFAPTPNIDWIAANEIEKVISSDS